jgi:flagellar hook-basal body complex protein FliE
MPTIPPIDPAFSVTGPEFRIDGVPGAAETGAETTGVGFGDLLGKSLGSLAASQTEAAEAAQALATGQASDPTAVVMAVERAQLAMQLASQIRTKAVEAAQDIFHTQV